MRAPWLYYSDSFLQHETAGHPESPQRLLTTLKQLDESGIKRHLQLRTPGPVDRGLLERLHHPRYLAEVEAFCQSAGSGRRIDEDTIASRGSYAAALDAAGAAVAMTEALLGDACDTAFSLVRPPGHHAMPQHTMGFCFFNNVALAALYALERGGLERVAILDWDAHHGNGTEHIFYRDPRVLFVSWHQDPNWPGTGKLEDIGEGPGKGYNLNIPLPVNYGDAAFLRSYEALVAPALERFKPQLILVSAGYDAHHADILTQMGLTATGFAQLTEAVMQTAERQCRGKAGFLLEGGYHVQALANSVTATLATLLQQQAAPFAERLGPPPAVETLALEVLIEKIRRIQPLLQKEEGP
ncbi:MAG: histone deacetylase family protein [Candidatus Sericytochromatia bacterium]